MSIADQRPYLTANEWPGGVPHGASSTYAPLAATFHENSKFSRATQIAHAPQVREFAERVRVERQTDSRFGRAPSINLLEDDLVPLGGLLDATAARRSTRSWADEPLTRQQLATILRVGTGSLEGSGRGAPSAGAKYPVECYVAVQSVEEVPAGIYYYDGSDHALRCIDPADPTDTLARVCLFPDYLAGASAVVLMTGVFSVTTSRYAEHGYRFVLLEAGHQAQGVCLAAAGVGGGSLCMAGFYEHEVDALLQVDGNEESLIHAVVLGRPEGRQPAATREARIA